MEQRICRVKIFMKFEMLWVKTFQIAKVNKGCLPFTKRFRKIWLESKWYMTFLVVPAENFREQRNI